MRASAAPDSGHTCCPLQWARTTSMSSLPRLPPSTPRYCQPCGLGHSLLQTLVSLLSEPNEVLLWQHYGHAHDDTGTNNPCVACLVDCIHASAADDTARLSLRGLTAQAAAADSYGEEQKALRNPGNTTVFQRLHSFHVVQLYLALFHEVLLTCCLALHAQTHQWLSHRTSCHENWFLFNSCDILNTGI